MSFFRTNAFCEHEWHLVPLLILIKHRISHGRVRSRRRACRRAAPLARAVGEHGRRDIGSRRGNRCQGVLHAFKLLQVSLQSLPRPVAATEPRLRNPRQAAHHVRLASIQPQRLRSCRKPPSRSPRAKKLNNERQRETMLCKANSFGERAALRQRGYPWPSPAGKRQDRRPDASTGQGNKSVSCAFTQVSPSSNLVQDMAPPCCIDRRANRTGARC